MDALKLATSSEISNFIKMYVRSNKFVLKGVNYEAYA